MDSNSFSVSVVITSYNQKEYLIEAIESVLNQTLMPLEIIIVDDCSSDGSQEVIKKYVETHSKLIKAYYHKRNLGIPKNRNFALKQVTGDLVTILDGDDTFLLKKLELEVETLKNHPEVGLVYSNNYRTNKDGRRIRKWIEEGSPPTGYVFKEVLGRDFPMGRLFRNELVHTRLLKEVEYYDESLTILQDWDFKIRLAHRTDFAFCPHLLAENRRHKNSITHMYSQEFRLEIMEKIFNKHLNLFNELSKEDQDKIKKQLSIKFQRLEALSELERGKILSTLKKYLIFLIHKPRRLKNFKSQIKSHVNLKR